MGSGARSLAAVGLLITNLALPVVSQEVVPLEKLDGQGEVLDLEALEHEVHTAVNAFREQRGLSPLDWDDELAAVARTYSSRMLNEAELEHDVGGSTTDQRLQEAGIGYQCACENLGFVRGFNVDPAQRAVTGWIYSQEHRENMLDTCVIRAGVGIAASPTGGFYVTWIARQPLR